MTSLDPIELARIQFALNISFHILFPTISIGLAPIPVTTTVAVRGAE
jgi:cytochrome bd-type quinol oxidase subunit 1